MRRLLQRRPHHPSTLLSLPTPKKIKHTDRQREPCVSLTFPPHTCGPRKRKPSVSTCPSGGARCRRTVHRAILSSLGVMREEGVSDGGGRSATRGTNKGEGKIRRDVHWHPSGSTGPPSLQNVKSGHRPQGASVHPRDTFSGLTTRGRRRGKKLRESATRAVGRREEAASNSFKTGREDDIGTHSLGRPTRTLRPPLQSP